METRARDLDREVYQDPDSDRHLIPSKSVFDNAADELETIAVSKSSISLLPEKEVVRTDLQPFKQEIQPLAKIWCVKMEEDTHQPNELNSQMRVMKTYLKARYRLSDLLRAQRNDRMTSNLKAVLTWKAPRTDAQLISFLGFVNYYREFIKGYEDKMYPMQRLMRNKGKKFEWNEEAQVAFENIQRELCDAASDRHAYRKGHVCS